MTRWLRDKFESFKQDCKQAWKSFTIWFNGIVGTAISILLALPVDAVISYIPKFQPYISDEIFRTIMVVLLAINGVNIALRFKTTKALKHK